MGFGVVLKLGWREIRATVARLNRNDGSDAYIIEIDGDELRKAGFDLERFKEEE